MKELDKKYIILNSKKEYDLVILILYNLIEKYNILTWTNVDLLPYHEQGYIRFTDSRIFVGTPYIFPTYCLHHTEIKVQDFLKMY